jgi:hypothetical protein
MIWVFRCAENPGKVWMLYATNAMKHWAICVFILASTSAFCADGPLPEGKGKDVVLNACSSCHSVDRIAALRLSEEGWRNTLRQMIENGASLNPDDINPILAYLVANFGGPVVASNTAVVPAPASIPAAVVPDKVATAAMVRMQVHAWRACGSTSAKKLSSPRLTERRSFPETRPIAKWCNEYSPLTDASCLRSPRTKS